eukprot:scaffold273524_cov31-Tisochrysis_lutea.AAC.3
MKQLGRRGPMEPPGRKVMIAAQGEAETLGRSTAPPQDVLGEASRSGGNVAKEEQPRCRLGGSWRRGLPAGWDISKLWSLSGRPIVPPNHLFEGDGRLWRIGTRE